MRTLILSLLVVLAAAAPASAGTITRGDAGGVLAYTYSDAVANRENRLSLQYVLGDADGQYHFSDPEGVTNSAGANCTVSSATLVKCQDNVSRIVISLGSGDDRLEIDHVLGADDGVPDPASIDGGTGNDRLEGTDLNDSINGSTGDDDLFGFGGADVLSGSAGADEIRGSNDPASPGDFSDAPDLADEITPGDNNDQAFGDLGADVITDTLGNNTVSGGDGDDQLTTGAGNDTVDGDANNDTIVDSGGTNTLRGAAGADTITAGPGNDTILGAAASTVGDLQDSITPGRGRDTVNGGLNGATGDTVSYGDSGRTAGVTVTLNAGAGNDGSADDESAGQRDTLTDVENVVGTSLADDVSGDVGANTLSGGGGNDVLRGAGGNDTLNAGDGDDLTSGGDGSDTINGGDGAADTVDYGDRVAPVKVTLNTTGRDDGSIPNDGATATTLDDVENVEVARGGAGNDELVAGAAGSTLVGAAGNDTLTGGAGPDTLDGGAGADTLDGRDGIDRVTYATAPEPVAVSLNDGAANDGGVQDTSGANRDTTLAIENVTGGPGADVLTGDGGPNLLDGGAGNDVLNGAGGADTFAGGDGDDTIEARDAVAEDVDCGAGTDGGSADLEDRLSACEAVDVPRPGGTPRLFIDTDNDGVPLGVDCDDNDARRFQGNAEIPGNALDEDCLGGPAPFSLTTATFSLFYETRGKRLKLTEWSLRTIPAGAKVRITCTPPKGKSHRKDCPFKTYTKTFTKATKRVSLLKTPLKNKLLTAGTKVRMEVTQPLAIGRVRVLTTRSAKLPKDTKNTLCRTPGATKDARCP